MDAYLVGMALRAAPKTVKEARAALERILRETGWSNLRDVDRNGMNAWRAMRKQAGISNRTINRQVGELRACLAFAVKDKLLDHNPIADVKPLPTKGKHARRRSRALRRTDRDKLLDAARAIDEENQRLFPRAPLLATLFDTGARWHELVQTTWGDLDEDRSLLRFRAETTKTSEARAFPINAKTLARLVELRADHTRVTGRFPTAQSRIFLAPKGGNWGQDTNRFHVFLREAMRRAGIEHTDSTGRVFHVHAARLERRS